MVRMNHCVICSVHGCCSNGSASAVPRRMTARATVVEFTQPHPPNRTLAMAARK
jgi:hypothetical protein